MCRLSDRLHFVDDISDIKSIDAITFNINGKLCSTKENLFSTFKTILKFPDYFGNNWDAFDDCIFDMEWIKIKYKKNKVNIFIYNLQYLLANEPDEKNRIIFFQTINSDYTINEKNEFDMINFPMNIHFYLLEKDRRYYIENESNIIWGGANKTI
jgi:RNAse (barnase) inhibitor barstar